MGFPRKFKHLLEIDREDMPPPKQVILTYSVCATHRDACEWQGWILEAAFNTSEVTCGPDHLLPSNYSSKCPRCGSDLFGTDASYRFDPSSQQKLLPFDFETAPMEYDDD